MSLSSCMPIEMLMNVYECGIDLLSKDTHTHQGEKNYTFDE